ncbi:antitoxin VbhA family protein [Bacillus tuaregi]|uniref:antitoxin VbhA family protein n=1 Tax=Bacillus tuaregi TaxID=1816695 RepID=UPI0008F8DD23|nr:antitoxin VbhA family protein [Bacillus tuaregi]
MNEPLKDKPTFTADQLIPATIAAKNFGSLRKKVKQVPQFITENGVVGEVLLDYQYYEEIYSRLRKLEQLEEKRQSWEYALDLNQIDGVYKPSPLLSELMEKETHGEISSDEIIEKLKQIYKQDE